MEGFSEVQFAEMVLARSLNVLLIVSLAKCTEVNPSAMDTFRGCLISQPAHLGQCLGVGAINKLHSLDNTPEFDLIDGVTLSRDAQEYRELNTAEGDPSSFRSIVETFNHVFSQRNMRWDMSYIYPGLELRVAPSTAPGGTLEFVLDPHHEAINVHSLKESSTGRLLARQFLVPFLLGFKFNVATIIPILFGLLALLAKKAVIISKFALIISSALGLGTLLFGYGNKVQQQYHQSGAFHSGFVSNGYKYPEDEYQETYYRAMAAQPNDQLRLYDNIQYAYQRTDGEEKVKGRNFAWSKDEKRNNKIFDNNQ